jgi:amino-acid N-acetyltransferase
MSMQSHSVASTPQWITPVFTFDVAEDVGLRAAMPHDVDVIHALIERHRDVGHLLPRTRAEIAAQIQQFVLAVKETMVVACGELVPLGADVAEVRSRVVSDELQGLGIGRAIVSALIEAAAHGPFQRVCAFTHAPAFFVRLGFSIVPHLHLPEKVFTDCVHCPLFRRCGQQAVVLSLDRAMRPSGCRELEW